MRWEVFERHYDIAVIGGGLCGVSAALKSAWEGKRVILIERRSALGWEVTWALELTFEPTATFACLGNMHSSVAEVIANRMGALGGYHKNRLDAVIAELLLDKLVEDAGIELLLYSTPTRLLWDDDLAVGVVIGNKSGEQVIHANVFIDATENAFLWRQAGAQFTQPQAKRGKQVVVFNGIAEAINSPITLGDAPDAGIFDVTVQPSIWDGEAFVEFTVEPFSALISRERILDAIPLVRERVHALSNALVTHSGHEPYPIDVFKCTNERSDELMHPHLKNLIGAGVWAIADDDERTVANTIGSRVALGERAGELAMSMHLEVPHDATQRAEGSILTPPHYETDVVVVGGGTAGAIAAIAAGRQGVKVALLEANAFLGGIGTGGAIHMYYHGVPGGIQDEVDARMRDITPLFGDAEKVLGFHPEAKKIVLQRMALEANVDIKLCTTVTGVQVEEVTAIHADARDKSIMRRDDVSEPHRYLRGVITAGVEGITVYRAHAFIDSTGDGDVAAMAGAPFIMGRDKDGILHAYSQPAGKLDEKGRLAFLNFDAGYVDPTDVTDITRARRWGIRHYWRERFTSEHRLLYIAPLLGIRQGRHILGDYQLTLMDEIIGRKFEDAIGYTWAHYDNHALDYENESDEAVFWVWLLGQWKRMIGCQVPYRCMLPQNVEGLLVACRAISLTHDAHHEFRMQRDMQRLGESAGVAAGLAVKRGITPRQVDIRELQAILRQTGALQDEDPIKPPLSLPLPSDAQYADATQALAQVPDAVIQNCVHALSRDEPQDAVWMLAHIGKRAQPALLNALNADAPQMRFWAAVALAMQGRDDGAHELLTCLKERRADVPEGRKTVPMWQAVMVLLGRIRAKEAVPELIKVLEDKSINLDALLTAVRALGRIGDSSAVPALLQLLQRNDLPAQRQFQISTGAVNAVVEDARWQIELTVAEALALLGAPQPQIVEKYLNDQRAYVRQYAHRVMEIKA